MILIQPNGDICFMHSMSSTSYAEGVTRCGGKNVASLLIKILHDSGLLDPTKGPSGHLIAPFDNCSGQKKTDFVLNILCAWLIEKCLALKGLCRLSHQGAHQEPLGPPLQYSQELP
jgi:hypothetical protein